MRQEEYSANEKPASGKLTFPYDLEVTCPVGAWLWLLVFRWGRVLFFQLSSFAYLLFSVIAWLSFDATRL
jgi:hypothetical protein